MPSEAPALVSTLLIADDPYIAAVVSCVLAKRGSYLPIIEAPRMQRLDAEAEVIRCNNAAARMQPTTVLLVGLPDDTTASLAGRFPSEKTHMVRAVGDLPALGHKRNVDGTLKWGKRNIGLGLLRALRERRQIVFEDGAESPATAIPAEAGCDHLVAYEEHTVLGAVIAANYAYSLGAGLSVIPEVEKEHQERILETFYGVYENRDRPVTETLHALQLELRERSGGLNLAGFRSVTFITQELPWGFAFPECPSTHLFSYPDLGKSILNGVLAEQPGAPGIRVAILIDPAEEQARDIAFAVEALKHRGVFVRGIAGKAATVYRVSRTLELFPYDFLMISTHCGDAPGWRWTYQFTDRDGRDRVLVIDVTIAVTAVPQDEKLEVVQFDRFVSLDGVDWNDPDKASKLVVGSAIHDYLDKVRAPERLMPAKKETIPRVIGSSALQLANGNYIPLPVSLADECTPIVLNNACSSWHRLAGNFTFGNARAYMGTLFPVTEFEAEEIADRLLNRQFGKLLAAALWHAQNDVFGDGEIRRPYALVGPHFQSLRTTLVNAPSYVVARLQTSLRARLRMMRKERKLSDGQRRDVEDHKRWLGAEIKHMRDRWLK